MIMLPLLHASRRYLLAALLLLTNWSAQADVFDLIRKSTMNTLELQIHVTNVSGEPLVGALIWYAETTVYSPVDPNVLERAALQRMAQRYRTQADFLNHNDIPEVVFRRTDLQGVYRDVRTGSGDKPVGYVVAVSKRGYQVQVLEGFAQRSRKNVVEVQLQRDPSAKAADPRMEALDRLIAQARSTSPDEEYTGEARMRKLEALYAQCRELAQSLEADGKADEASAVYWQLADFPEVLRAKTADGSQAIVGYRSSRQDAQAEQDRVKATQLNTRVPKLLIGKMMMAQGFTRTGIQDATKGHAYLDAFNTLASRADIQRILPAAYETAVYQGLRWGTPEQTCSLLQRAYAEEPATMSVAKWHEMLTQAHKQRERSGSSSPACVIPSLPDFARK